MLYNGYSPDGRIIGGYVEINKEEILTYYTYNKSQDIVFVWDHAKRIDDDHFNITAFKKEKCSTRIIGPKPINSHAT